ncbi:LLM class flavin-dependent oxidoreductase [Galbitalea sp. SE-J8]|uniref:LLM class flavin-dependent oxidoreductase n=1 Tax=Galbitalea sp. SE-J8 TaxID=3054952 RepID=UPI00259C7B0C|nr:LLM class flavin-dependent oxidoreductase [Galbitalea sp. SE-J8]MDM4763687.1 LLM class flavin-dependent oxidoreductase [Galbitalea sp. SE-J8]
MSAEPAELGLGLPGDTAADVVAEVAARAEALGYASFWLNDTPHGDALAGLAAAAGATTRIRLASGVLALDRWTADGIRDAVSARRLPVDRLVIGLGAGGLRHPLARVRATVRALRDGSGARIVVGALGPRMRELAARDADGVLLNWLTPAAAAEATRDLRAAAGATREPRSAVPRDAPRSIFYLRTAVDADARAALDAQIAMYAGIPAYARNFAATGVDPADAAIDAAGVAAGGLDAYRRTVDELVLRAVVRVPNAANYLDVATRAAAAAGR